MRRSSLLVATCACCLGGPAGRGCRARARVRGACARVPPGPPAGAASPLAAGLGRVGGGLGRQPALACARAGEQGMGEARRRGWGVASWRRGRHQGGQAAPPGVLPAGRARLTRVGLTGLIVLGEAASAGGAERAWGRPVLRRQHQQQAGAARRGPGPALTRCHRGGRPSRPDSRMPAGPHLSAWAPGMEGVP